MSVIPDGRGVLLWGVSKEKGGGGCYNYDISIYGEGGGLASNCI